MAKLMAGSVTLPVFAALPGYNFRQNGKTHITTLTSGSPDTAAPYSDAWAFDDHGYWKTDSHGRPPIRVPSIADTGGASIADFDRYPVMGVGFQDIDPKMRLRHVSYVGSWQMAGASGTSLADAMTSLNTAIADRKLITVNKVRPGAMTAAALKAAHATAMSPFAFKVPQGTADKFAVTGETVARDVTTESGQVDAILAFAADAWVELLAGLEQPEWKLVGDQPQIGQYTAQSGSKVWYAVRQATVTGGKWFAAGSIDVPVVFDDATRRFSMVADYSSVTGAFAAARTAQRAYNDSMKKAIAEKLDGKAGPLDVSADRPAATLDPRLTTDEKLAFDKWWRSMEETRLKVNASTSLPTEDQAYANYSTNGGPLPKADWLAARATRVAAATAGDSDSPSWLNTVKSALGQTSTFVADNLGKLGSGVLDLLKSWGPTGTVGAYAGAKAVNAAGSDSSKFLMYGALAVGALMVLK